MSDEFDTQHTPVVTVHNYGADLTVLTSADRQHIDVMIGAPASTERDFVCAWSKTAGGEIQFSMMLVGQPQLTYTLTKVQAQMISAALNRACQCSL